MRVLILYTELAGYVLSNIRGYLKSKPASSVMLIHYPVNPEAPFDLKFPLGSEAIIYRQQDESSIEERIMSYHADIVLCSGWSNPFYLQLIRKLPSNVKKVLCFDNPWNGSLKQWMNCLRSRLLIRPLFSHLWVPGLPQKKYGLKLGFRENVIYTGLYAADTELFSAVGNRKILKKGPFPKIMMSVARYIPQKNLPVLWKAFILANEKNGNQWKLHCFGFGDLYSERITHPSIVHFGFKQPEEMLPYIEEAGIFVLPSKYEPWGVAVHEMALSAMPMILSERVGAASMFLKQDNGWSFEPDDVTGLARILSEAMNKTDAELWAMAERSFLYGMRLQTSNWSDTIHRIAEC